MYVAEPHEVLIKSEHLKVGDRLGQGAFSSVWKGVWDNSGVKVGGCVCQHLSFATDAQSVHIGSRSLGGMYLHTVKFC